MLALQALFSGLGVVAVALVGRQLFDARVAAAAAALAAAHPGLVYYDVRNLHPLGLDSAALMWTVCLVVALRTRRSARLAFFAGCVLGVAVVQRGSPAPMVALIPFWLWWSGERPKLGRQIVWLVAGVGLLVGPVLVRNAVIHNRLVVSTMSGEQLWIGNAPGSYGSNLLPSGVPVLSTAPPELARVRTSELERDRLFTAAAWEIIGADPIAFVARTSRKFLYFWTFSPQTGVSYPGFYKTVYLL